MLFTMKQNNFSLRGNFEIYNPEGELLYLVEGDSCWKSRLHIVDLNGNRLGSVESSSSFMKNRFGLFIQEEFVGEIEEKNSFLKSKYAVNDGNWMIEGNTVGSRYEITAADKTPIAEITTKQRFKSNISTIEIYDEENIFSVLLSTLAVTTMLAEDIAVATSAAVALS